MKRTAWLGGLLCALAVGQPAAAGEAPAAPETATCDSVETASERTLMAYWLDGYLSGRRHQGSYRPGRFDVIGLAVARACEDDPERTLLSILETLRRE